jgi:hypothetical protein
LAWEMPCLCRFCFMLNASNCLISVMVRLSIKQREFDGIEDPPTQILYN